MQIASLALTQRQVVAAQLIQLLDLLIKLLNVWRNQHEFRPNTAVVRPHS